MLDHARHAIEDRRGSGARIELSACILVDTELSKVIVADSVAERALARGILPHGKEIYAGAANVEAAMRGRLTGEPGGMVGVAANRLASRASRAAKEAE